MLELFDIEDEKINKSLEEAECINMERAAIINKIKNLNEIAKLRVQLKENIFDNLSLRSSIKEKDLNRLITPLELKKNSPISTKAKIEYHNIKGAYYFKIKNYEKALAQMKMKLNCIEHFPLTNLSILRKYFGTITNIITAQSVLSLFNDVTISIEKLNKLMVNDVVIKNIPFQKMIILQQLLFRIKLHVAKAELEEALKLIPEIESTLKKYQGSISIEVKSTFYIYLGYIYFMAEDFKKALVWMNRLENEIGSSTRQDIQTLCRLQLMILYYELGYDELIGYLQRATSHSLIKKGEMYKTEAAILGFFKKEPRNSNSQKELTTIFRKLKVRITALLVDPFEANMLNSLDIISWIDSKIENRRLIEVLREKEQRRIAKQK
ncbi:MAG: hypothetical protein HYU69_00275 [Bacteroidetes bacterium]|nr:hypothetical protein [Bacteroidota bacterium]